MRWDIIGEVIRREAAYWMALIVCPTREHWEETYGFYYTMDIERVKRFDVPFIIDFHKELCRE